MPLKKNRPLCPHIESFAEQGIETPDVQGFWLSYAPGAASDEAAHTFAENVLDRQTNGLSDVY